MTPRQRVQMAVRHEQPDFVPYVIPIDAEVAGRLDDHYGGQEWRARIVNHVTGAGVGDGREDLPDGSGYRDAWGCVWRNVGIFHTTEVPLPEPTLEGYQFPALYTEEVQKTVAEAARKNAESPNAAYFTAGSGMTFFERAWSLRGMQDLLLDMVANPHFAHELFEALMEWHLPMIEGFGSIAEVDAIRFGDDFGSQRGVIMGPTHFREYLKPRLKVMYDLAHKHGKDVYIHSCGDNSPILADLIEIGLDVYNPFQPEPQDVYALKREYGKDLTFEGGIGTQVLLPFGTPEGIRAEIRRLKTEIGKGGGFIISPTKPILPDVPTENAVACVEAILEV